MIPKFLKIKGLYSYQSEQEVDFDLLTEAALFGIFGSVGSGKSSILEAITFALYGDTERLNSKGDDRSYNMMNLRSDELSIDFECMAGKEGNRYRFSVKGKRSAKNFKEVKAFERKAYQWFEGAWNPIAAENAAEQVIGLSYDNFRRTIIIPQGRFQEFIELKDADRTKMMKELFHLNKYDLGGKVGSLNKKNELEISNLTGQLQTLGEATPEIVAQETLNLHLVKEAITHFSKQLDEQNAFEKALEELKQVTAKIQILTEQQADLLHQKPAFLVRQQALKQYETCASTFKTVFELKQNNALVLARLQHDFTNNKKQLDDNEEQSKYFIKYLEDNKTKYEQREKLLAKSKELEKVIEILEKKTLKIRKEESLERGKIKQTEAEDAIESLKNQRLQVEENYEKIKHELPDIQAFSEVKSWFTTLDAFNETKKSTKLEAEEVKHHYELLTKTITENISEINAKFSIEIPPEAKLEVLEEHITTFCREADTQRIDLNQRIQTLNTRAALQQYASQLAEGLECPLCGATHHPSVLNETHDFDSEIQQLKLKVSHLEEVKVFIKKAESGMLKYYSQVEHLDNNKMQLRKRWNELKLKLENHDEAFKWAGFDRKNRESFERTFNSVAVLQKEIALEEQKIKQLSAHIEAEMKAKTENIDNQIIGLQNEILSLNTSIDTLTKQLEKVQTIDYESNSKEEIVAQVNRLTKEYDSIKFNFEENQRKVTAFEQVKNTLIGSQNILLETIESSQQQLNTYQQTINQLLIENAFHSESAVSEILAQNLNVDIERKTIEEFLNTLKNTQELLVNLRKDYGNFTYNAEQHAEVSAKKQTISEQLNYQRKEEGRIDGILRKAQEDLSKKIGLLNAKNELEIRGQHLEDLGKLFRGNGFVDFVSSIYLQNLCHAANVRFHKMTRQQLHLELGEDNSFWVRDVMNGGKSRLLKTLSGGQKFQAALSLALALADNIHTLTESKHNFFFLDEGFGSLDRESLQVVFETLKSLRKENRIVGIISHVEDLQQEIDRYLKVHNSEEFGSVVEMN